MPDPAFGDASEVFSAPLESFIVALAKGISEAQGALDRNSLATQREIDADPALAAVGVQATWYQFPRVDLQLKVSMSVVEDRTQPSPPAPAAVTTKRIHVQPVSAAFQNHFGYTADASSTISLSIVPVPGPNPAGTATSPLLSPDAAQAAAFATQGAHFAKTRTRGIVTLDPALRLDVNYNPSTQLWFVMQHDPLNPDATPVIVVVDDRTRKTRIISTK